MAAVQAFFNKTTTDTTRTVKILLSFFLIISSTTLFAQPDEQATAILDKVSATYKAYTNIEVAFDYVLQNKDAKVNDKRDGKLVLAGQQFQLLLMGQNITSDGKIVWYDMGDEVQIKSIDEFMEETDLDPRNIFTQYTKGFKTKYKGEKILLGKDVHVIDLYPEVLGKKPYSRIELSIDKATNQIVSSTTFAKDGTNYTLAVRSMKTNTTLPAGKFVFDKKAFEAKGYDVVDFR